MQIKSIEAFVVRIPYNDNKPSWGAGFWASDHRRHPGRAAGFHGDITTEYPPLWRARALYPTANETVIVKITADSGLVGWGEAHTPVAGEITVTTIDTLLAPLLIGKNPFDIHPLWETMYASMRLRGHRAGYLLEAIAGIDIALWDMAGKALNAPVSKLLGGRLRERIPVYASSLPRIHADAGEAGQQALIEAAGALVASGHKALKIKLGLNLDQDIALLERLRAEFPADTLKIAVDINGAYDPPMARRAGELMAAAAQIWWLEEPIPPEFTHEYARLTEFLEVPVAGGECLFTRWDFNAVLAANALDIVQPDVGRAGGLSECKRISDLAEIYGVPFAPHVSTGTAIYMAASLQWAASGATLMTCEWPLDQDMAGSGILREPFNFADGYVILDDRPGLGIDIDESALRRWQA